MKDRSPGFTLIELLVVIAIIGLLSSIVFASLNSARQKARIAKSLADLKELQKALEMYYADHRSYPSSQGGAGSWDGLYSCWGDSTPNWIPGLAPTYIARLPRSPNNSTGCGQNYIYNSNGNDYKLIWHQPENCEDVKRQYPSFIDPIRDCWAYGVWTPGARNW
ncbi:prepilin-type N-terminal cleavage/methylation domain-containing protein [Candidatus Parcubacteria bacterium]|nr:MAG: prepilin-type N-terminal cleavage/methylation domain-containing protein [Candidatus Parcubacteria bacterium]